MGGVLAKRIVLLALALASVGWSQSISSLQSSFIEGSPQNVTAITSGTNFEEGAFTLYINGAFNVNNFVSVQWLNLATNVSTTFTTEDASVTPTRIRVNIPNALFATLVSSPVQVRITVQETAGSAQALFGINPPLASVQPFLPAGTVNVPYNSPYYTGGTGPFDASQTTGTLPPGLTASLTAINGTPLQTGVFNFQTVAFDFWGNHVQGDARIEIVAVPAITLVTPGQSGAGAANLTIVVNGTNFVNAVVSGNQTLPGSQVQWKVNGVTTPLATTFTNSTSLTAVVPSALLAAPANADLVVQQPSLATSLASPFAVLAPVITTIVPSVIPAGSPTTPLTVNGANFTTNVTKLPNGVTVPVVPTITLNGVPLVTTFINSGQLAASIPANKLISPGPLNIQVVNPGGALSNVLAFNVLAPVLSSIAPTAVPVGSAAFVIGAAGLNFLNGSQIVFNGTPLTTTFNEGSLSATVPATLLTKAGAVNVTVTNPSGATTNALPFSILSPSLSAISPVSVLAGSAGISLVATGTNFVPGAQVLFDGGPLTTTFGSATSVTAMVPGTLLTGPKVATISVANPGVTGNVTAGLPFTVIGTLSIATTVLPSGVAGVGYTTVLTAKGGTPPYTWSATGYPPALSLNTSTGAVSGVPLTGGTYTVNVSVTDASKAVASAQFPLVVAPPPVSISPSGVGLPTGTVGVPYSGSVSASGGAAPYAFSLGGGNLPDGLTLSSGGVVTGTPKTPGQFSFALVVTDANGVTGSRDTSITILPAPLIINGGPTTEPPVVGTPTTITFTGTGGVPPYRYTPCSPPPPGMTFINGVLSGTPTTAGTFTICLVIGDNTGATVTKTFTLTITDAPTPPAKLTLGGTLGEGKVGVAYSGQIAASGGTGPYTYSGSGMPDGLTLSSSGGISGTPSTDGAFSLSASVTDSKAATASAIFSITITPADITILTGSLPDGVVDVAYSVTLSASGGNKTYTWTISGLPDGLTATAAGVISGTPKTAGKSTVSVSVQDSTGSASARRTTLSLTILPAPLVISTITVPNATAGAPYSVSVQVSGGTAPFTYSATGLPAGLSISATGVISGTPTTPGTSNIVVTVRDAAGVTVTKSFTVTVGLPSTPTLIFSGVGDTANPLQQPRLQVSLSSPFPVDIVVTLTLTFAPDSGPDDPAIQFSSGGRTARITVPAGATAGATDVGIQTGTVAGQITITAQTQAGDADVTPSPAPRKTIRIAAGVPVIVTGSVAAVRNATGFTVTLSGYVTDREMTQAIFTFSGSNLQTTTLTVSIDALFAQYFGSASAAATGGQFTFTQPFAVTGSTQSITSVTVTLVNRIGQSAAVTVNLN